VSLALLISPLISQQISKRRAKLKEMVQGDEL
jgi:hypothetical protein